MPDKENQQNFLPGLKNVRELLQENPQKIDQILTAQNLPSREIAELKELAQKKGIKWTCVPKDVLQKICARQGGGNIAHQGVVARLVSFSFADLDDVLQHILDAPLPLLLALDNVQDPGNVGTMVRTCYALGGAGIILPSHNSAHLGPAAHKTSQGALEKLPLIRTEHLGRTLDTCEEFGCTIYGSGAEKPSANLYTTPILFPCVFVLGNEANGLRPDIRKRCSTMLHIPMLRPFHSLNVAQAGAILLARACECRKRE